MKLNPCPFTHALQFSCCRIVIVLSIDGVCMLANIVIVNFIQVDLILWATLSHGVV
jgi:hypothetical protein